MYVCMYVCPPTPLAFQTFHPSHLHPLPSPISHLPSFSSLLLSSSRALFSVFKKKHVVALGKEPPPSPLTSPPLTLPLPLPFCSFLSYHTLSPLPSRLFVQLTTTKIISKTGVSNLTPKPPPPPKPLAPKT